MLTFLLIFSGRRVDRLLKELFNNVSTLNKSELHGSIRAVSVFDIDANY